jgi:hypothetical protein
MRTLYVKLVWLCVDRLGADLQTGPFILATKGLYPSAP